MCWSDREYAETLAPDHKDEVDEDDQDEGADEDDKDECDGEVGTRLW